MKTSSVMHFLLNLAGVTQTWARECAKKFPEEPCFKDDCYGLGRWKRDVEVTYTPQLDNSSATFALSSIFLRHAFHCEDFKDNDGDRYHDCVRAQQDPRAFLGFPPIDHVRTDVVHWRDTNTMSSRRRRETVNLGFPQTGIEEHVWDPKCCRLTQSCYDFFWDININAPEPGYHYTKHNSPEIFDHAFCCVALLASSCQDFSKKGSMPAPTHFYQPPACTNPDDSQYIGAYAGGPSGISS